MRSWPPGPTGWCSCVTGASSTRRRRPPGRRSSSSPVLDRERRGPPGSVPLVVAAVPPRVAAAGPRAVAPDHDRGGGCLRGDGGPEPHRRRRAGEFGSASHVLQRLGPRPGRARRHAGGHGLMVRHGRRRRIAPGVRARLRRAPSTTAARIPTGRTPRRCWRYDRAAIPTGDEVAITDRRRGGSARRPWATTWTPTAPDGRSSASSRTRPTSGTSSCSSRRVIPRRPGTTSSCAHRMTGSGGCPPRSTSTGSIGARAGRGHRCRHRGAERGAGGCHPRVPCRGGRVRGDRPAPPPTARDAGGHRCNRAEPAPRGHGERRRRRRRLRPDRCDDRLHGVAHRRARRSKEPLGIASTATTWPGGSWSQP